MFGPNARYPLIQPKNYSHRSQYALDLVASVKSKLTTLFDLQDYDLLLIPGPATVAMQTVLDSCRFRVNVIGNGKFDNRWRDNAEENHLGTEGDSEPDDALLYCLLETSESRHTIVNWATRGRDIVIVDAVSAFPYYSIPEHASVFVTSSNKQLGGPPGISIVGVRRDCWSHFEYFRGSRYTSIRNHADAGFYTTAPINVLEVLDATLTYERLTEQTVQIEMASGMLNRALPPDITIGERRCPVITVKKEPFDAAFPGVAKQFDLYPETGNTDRYHIFTYSEALFDYERLAKAINDARKS